MNAEVTRKEAVDDINNAIEFDKKGLVNEAFGYYVKGIGKLLFSVKYSKNKQLKTVTLVKVSEYLDRMEALKSKMNDEQKKAETPTEQEEDVIQTAIMNTKIKTSDLNVTFKDVIGLEQAKESLHEAVILPKKFPSMFKGQRQPWSAILLYGPPGTGKSFIAKAVASESESNFFSISSSDIMSKWQGESEKSIKVLFEQARKDAPSVIFIDEIDSIAGERFDGENDSTRRVKTQLMIEMQGVGNNNTDVLVLAATNTPWTIDSAFRRRFQKRIYIGLPNKRAVVNMVKDGLDGMCNITDPEYEEIGELMEGYSGSDVSNVVRDALMIPIRKCREAKQFIKTDNKFTPVLDYPNCSKCPLDLTNDPSRGKICSECGAHCKLMDDLTDDTIEIPTVSLDDIKTSVGTMHKTVSHSELEQYDKWTELYGQNGTI